ncbi:DNA_polymerase [Hexamita inflata]|uniref:DNA polymerase n=1 Tax=Hexamita inflata TaxID=28002 RepID=A0AA86TP13_9EUKA|nr:DNA polymerase [Hexamita inflata]
MSTQDDFESSSSISFQSDSEAERRDLELERQHLKADLKYGGLDDESDQQSENQVDEQVKEKVMNEQFQKPTKYNNAEVQEAQKKEADLILQSALNDLANIKQQPMQTDTKMDRVKAEKLAQIQARNENQKMRQAKLKEAQEIDQMLEQKKKLLQQYEQVEKQKIEAGILLPSQQKIVKEEYLLDDMMQPDEAEIVQQDYKPKQLEIKQKEQIHFQLFDDQEIEVATQNVEVVVQTQQSQDQVTFETYPKQIGSISNKKLNIFAYNIESQRNESEALIWGKVIVFDDRKELQQGFNPLSSQVQNCCVLVSGLVRQVYMLPADNLNLIKQHTYTHNGLLQACGQIVQDQHQNYVKYIDQFDNDLLNDNFKQYKQQLQNVLAESIGCPVAKIKIEPVIRVYTFNDSEIPRDARMWLRVRYDASFPSLNVPEILNKSENTIKQIIGMTVRPLDLFLAENQIRGASWLQISGFQAQDYLTRFQELLATSQKVTKSNYFNQAAYKFQKSTCFHEFQLNLNDEDAKITSAPLEQQPQAPPLSTATINFRKLMDPQSKQEIPVIVQLTYQFKNQLQNQSQYPESTAKTYIIGIPVEKTTPYSAQLLGMSLDENLGYNTNEKKRIHQVEVIACHREAEMIFEMFKLINILNPDIIECHGLHGHFSQIMKRILTQMPFSQVKTNIIQLAPRLLTNMLSEYQIKNADPSKLVHQLFQGRICADLEKIILEFSPDTKQTSLDYQLDVLIDKEIILTPNTFIPDIYKDLMRFKNKFLPELVREQLALLQLGRSLNYLQLTAKISQLTYFQLQNVLSLGRAKRVEMLLFTNFVQVPFVIPDYQQQSEEHDKFEGGYVIEPKPGLYDSVVIVLDFNSLYPSLIREFDICFTTVPPNVSETDYLEFVPQLSERIFSKQLPRIIGELVIQRQSIKKKIKEVQVKQKTDNNEQYKQMLQELDIHQLALKLCANSMYGSLGYEKGRFFCPKVAASIPNRGRQELNNAVGQAKMAGYDVIYGDTDSIMIDSKLKIDKLSKEMHGQLTREGKSDIDKIVKQCSEIAGKISKKISEGKKFLEMGLDYIFARQLLLAKKKYAALKINNNIIQLEVRGLDMVRRDWCELSREVSKKAVDILMWKDASNGIEDVIQFIRNIAQKIADKDQALKWKHFMMTKSISKPLDQYKGATDNLAHVNVARQLQAKGRNIKPGFVVEYLVLSNKFACEYLKVEGEIPQFQRCVPFEDHIKFSKLNLVDVLDIEWYVIGQILPPLERLCTPIPDLSKSSLAQCFGISIAEPASTNLHQQTKNTLSADMREQFDSCACFLYTCSCGQVRYWPEYPATSPDIPLANLDEPSKASRTNLASQHDQPLLAEKDLVVLPCGHAFDEQTAVNCLLKQMNYYENVYYSNVKSCSHNKCAYNLSSEIQKQIQRGTVDLNFKEIQALINYACDKTCVSESCQSGELVEVYPREQYLKQLLFFQELFDIHSPLYVRGGASNGESIYLVKLKETADYMVKQSGITQVKVSEVISKYFK